ncbi:MFS transporter [Sphingomonas turrisvirgatae]|uniref:Major facilitator superfamily (MFS) profile domain-containing protein n=1 Tax=Sphingomonas turrisvirgatae TaxID=1888892 RepID=A0A1E3LVI3_9SPHN|nr:MFS transporter [Sphingomonas turrisvirgatae]ODP37754.1 hypothetical protein BFL28_01930 [Sphingomonas turrisvirgatae]
MADRSTCASAPDTGQLVLLGGIAALGSLAIQIIVPALPLLTTGIGASPRDGQLVISSYLAALAACQLIAAPLADRFGRRPLLIGGLVAFLGGCVACALAENLAVMLIGRCLQASGAAAALVAARTMATDGAGQSAAAARLAILTSVTLISPAVAPAVGGAVVGIASWPALFWLLAGVTLLSLIAALRLIGETRTGDPEALRPGPILRSYGEVARHPRYLRIALANGMINGGFYLFLAVSPFTLTAAGAGPMLSGLFYSLVACAIILGSLAVPVIARRHPAALLPVGSAALGFGAAAVVAVAATGSGPWGLLIAMSLISFGAGLTGPTLQAEAIAGRGQRTSTATSLLGTIQMASAAAISTAVVRLSPTPTVSLALIGALIAGALILRRRPA